MFIGFSFDKQLTIAFHKIKNKNQESWQLLIDNI